MTTNPQKPHDTIVYSTDSWIRCGYSAYPIFSLHKSDVQIAEEYRERCSRPAIPYQEIDLPGETESEIGFVPSPEQLGQDIKLPYTHQQETAGEGCRCPRTRVTSALTPSAIIASAASVLLSQTQ